MVSFGMFGFDFDLGWFNLVGFGLVWFGLVGGRGCSLWFALVWSGLGWWVRCDVRFGWFESVCRVYDSRATQWIPLYIFTDRTGDT
jgi:hypothetical protein